MATHHETGVTHADGDAHGHHHSVAADRVPAFVGLIGGLIFVGGVLFGVVKWTNAQFAGHGEGTAAEATK